MTGEDADAFANVLRKRTEERFLIGDASKHRIADFTVFLDDPVHLGTIVVEIKFRQHDCGFKAPVVASNEVAVNQTRMQRRINDRRDDEQQISIRDHIATLPFPASATLQQGPTLPDADEFRQIPWPSAQDRGIADHWTGHYPRSDRNLDLFVPDADRGTGSSHPKDHARGTESVP